MANIMTKMGNSDNIVTYEHICDTVEDLESIKPEYSTLGSVAVVLNSENDSGLKVYMANSQKEWINVFADSDDSEGSGEGSSGEGSSGDGGADQIISALVAHKVTGEFVVPDGTDQIGYGAFVGCTDLTKVVLPDSCKIIGDGGFQGCYKLADINLSKVETIGIMGNVPCFGGATGLKSINLASIRSITGSAFGGCVGLENVYIGPNCLSIASGAFGGVPVTCKVECGFAEGAVSGFPSNAGFSGNPALLNITYNVPVPTVS